MAKNPEMCHSLTSENCGVTCTWVSELVSDVGMPEERVESCRAVDEDRLAVVNAFAQLFADMYSQIFSTPYSCIDNVETRADFRDSLSKIESSSDFINMLNGATIRIQQGSVHLVVTDTGFSSESFEISSDVDALSDVRVDIDISVSEDGSLQVYADGSRLYNRGDDMGILFEYGIDTSDGISLEMKEFSEVRDDFEDSDVNVKFCRRNIPYSLGLVNTDDECADISNIDTCLMHSEYLDGYCGWLRRKSSTTANILTLFTASLGNRDECLDHVYGTMSEAFVEEIESALADASEFFAANDDGTFSPDIGPRGLVLQSIGNDTIMYLDDGNLARQDRRNWAQSENFELVYVDTFEDTVISEDGQRKHIIVVTSEGARFSFEEDNQLTKIDVVKE